MQRSRRCFLGAFDNRVGRRLSRNFCRNADQLLGNPAFLVATTSTVVNFNHATPGSIFGQQSIGCTSNSGRVSVSWYL
jgi:hypothetical protein